MEGAAGQSAADDASLAARYGKREGVRADEPEGRLYYSH